MKKKKLKTKIKSHAKIVEAVTDISENGFFELFVTMYSSKTLFRDFAIQLREEDRDGTVYIFLCGKYGELISDMKPGFKKHLDILLKRIQSFFRKAGYDRKPVNELIDISDMNMMPSLHGSGLSKMMILFYYISMNIFDGENFETVKAAYLKEKEEEKARKGGEDDDPYQPIRFRLNDNLLNSEHEIDFNVAGKNPEDMGTEDDYREIAKRLDCEYDPENFHFNKVSSGAVAFFFEKLDDMLERTREATVISGIMVFSYKKLKAFADNQKGILTDRIRLKTENRKLLKKIKGLKKDVSKLSAPLKKKSSTGNMEREITELKKKNYYLQSRIESLEEYVAELEEEKRINKEIEEKYRD